MLDDNPRPFSPALTEPRVTVHLSPYHAWQGRPEDAPKTAYREVTK